MGTHFIEQMSVEISGSGEEAVILVHGLGGTSNAWAPLAGTLQGRYRVIRPDLPGSGRSPTPERLTLDLMIERLAALTTVLGVRRAHLIGHSLGTLVCLHLAARQPSRVRSLALIGPFTAPREAARTALRTRARGALREGMADIADQVVSANTAAATRARNPLCVAFVRELLMRQPAQGYAATCEALADAEPADLGAIGAPALLMTGDEDPVAPVSDMRAMQRVLADASASVLSRCGHWAPLEKVDEVNRAIGGFLAGAR